MVHTTRHEHKLKVIAEVMAEVSKLFPVEVPRPEPLVAQYIPITNGDNRLKAILYNNQIHGASK